ncbi:MAG: methyltransferase domain-containing protein [Planctomycetota bacterium]|nr:methyltransferase domain-containing protein [Planctomycetota bacterium]
MCNHVMQCVPDDRKGFREMFRVLKPGGFAIIQVALALDFAETYEVAGLEINRANTIKHYGHSYNVRLYGLDYVDRIEDAGFVAEKHNIFTERWVPDPERHGLDPREDVYVFRKPAR